MSGAGSDLPALELSGIEKRFGAVHANKAIDLVVRKGSVHGIVGENGAGKSTLMSIIYGFYEADAGEIRVDGKPVRIRTPSDAIKLGIGMVHQHFMLVETMSVLDNVLLGAEGGALLTKGQAKARQALAELGARYQLPVDPDAIVGELSVGQQQRVEILKALYRGAEILILDEPTAVLTPSEADQLFELVRALRDQGKSILLITHKLREIMAVTDQVSVMRRGAMVGTLATSATNPSQLAEMMVGQHLPQQKRNGSETVGAPVLSVRDLTVKDGQGTIRLNGCSFTLHAGEILGIAAVSGNGQSELLEALAGMRPAIGQIEMAGITIDPSRPDAARMRELGLLHVPEDRHRHGLVLPFAAAENGMLGHHHAADYGAGVRLDHEAAEKQMAARMQQYDVRPQDPTLRASRFSGGNQQKIVLAREMERGPRVLLVGQPTRGVDIGAIAFIHQRIREMRAAGAAILLVSVELEEILTLSDRILCLCAGRITGERRPAETNERELGLMMAGAADPVSSAAA
jgi:general nucleoside transport system ATP-binding protein